MFKSIWGFILSIFKKRKPAPPAAPATVEPAQPPTTVEATVVTPVEPAPTAAAATEQVQPPPPPAATTVEATVVTPVEPAQPPPAAITITQPTPAPVAVAPPVEPVRAVTPAEPVAVVPMAPAIVPPAPPPLGYDSPDVRNVYPELPVIEYQKTTIGEGTVVAYIGALVFPLEVKRATYVFFVNESAHGSFGINNNYGGIQADGARWASKWDAKIIATTVTPEMMTGKPRRFCVFDKWESSIDLLLDRIQSRGIYFGGHAHPYANFDVQTVDDFAKAYWQEWVEGDQTLPPQSQVKDIEALYAKAVGFFTEG